MNRKTIHFGQAFTEGWDVFKKNAGMAIAGYLIFMGLATVAGYIICVGTIAWVFFLQFPLWGGFTLFYLNMVKGRKPEINDIFAGFRDFGKWLGVGWLFILIFLASMIPLMISGLVAGVVLYPLRQAALDSEPALANGLLAGMIASLVIGAFVSAIIWIILTVRYFFVYYAAAEGAGVLEAFGQGAELTRGVRFQLLLIAILLTLFTMAGIVLFFIGQYFTAIIAKMVYTAIYLDLKEQMHPDQPVA